MTPPAPAPDSAPAPPSATAPAPAAAVRLPPAPATRADAVTPACPKRVERFETVVIGAGQAGLAVGHHLAARDVDFVILSDESRVGDNWRKRWDSLRLFTPARYSGLPGMPFPASPLHLPDKDEVADYLARYVERFDLPVQSPPRVTNLAWDGQRYLLSAGRVTYQANNVIVATGPFQRPR